MSACNYVEDIVGAEQERCPAVVGKGFEAHTGVYQGVAGRGGLEVGDTVLLEHALHLGPRGELVALRLQTAEQTKRRDARDRTGGGWGTGVEGSVDIDGRGTI